MVVRTRSSAARAEPSPVARTDEDGTTISFFPDGRAEVVFTRAQDWRSIVKRRLLCLVAASYLLCPLLLAPLSFVFWGTAAKTILVALVALYAAKFFDRADQKGGREWEALRLGRPWRLVHRYFGTVSVREAPLDPERTYLVAMHPHGIAVLSKFFYYGGVWEDLFPGVRCRILGATPMFYVPALRDACLWLSIVNAGRKFAERFLQKGFSIMLYPGGSKEIFLTDPDSSVTTVILWERKGFIRLALRNGAHLVPSFVFGEKWAYDLIRPPTAVKNFFLKTLKLPVLLFWGRWGTLIPKRVPLMIVYGKPIEVQKTENPTDEQVEELQRQYAAALRDIFDRYKGRAGYSDNETLEII